MEQDLNEVTLAVQQAVIQRDIARVKAVVRPPPLIELFLGLPEVFILVALVGFVCCSVEAAQLPLLLVMIIFANGMVIAVNVSFE